MDVTSLSITISLGSLLTIASVVLGILGYRLNKRKNEAEQSKQREEVLREAVAQAKAEDAEKKDIAVHLTEIKLELVHIRERQDEEIRYRQDHEKRIQALEKKVIRKGDK